MKAEHVKRFEFGISADEILHQNAAHDLTWCIGFKQVFIMEEALEWRSIIKRKCSLPLDLIQCAYPLRLIGRDEDYLKKGSRSSF